jgi:lipopolysaccharide/colanic/teichoic acid biosynthesis glycosyltransferase
MRIVGQQLLEASMEHRTLTTDWWLDYHRVKLALDYILAFVLLFFAWPVMLLSMLAVRMTSSGPPLYFQKRLGHRGRPITIYKIRTMHQDCEKKTGAIWSVPGDPRITRVGQFLRWSHLDELPQLLNVLRGDMSLIGPRPERPEIVAQLEKVFPQYRRRLEIRPGLTGLAQVLLAPDTDLQSVRRKLDLDLQYVDQISPSLDLRILLATPFHIVRFPSHRIAQLFRFSSNELGQSITLATPESGSEGVQVEASCAS